MLHIPNIFTLEASFHGFNGESQGGVVDFTPTLYKNIGKNVCISLLKLILEEN